MTPEQINEQYSLASHWFKAILFRLDEAIIPLTKLSDEEIVESWVSRNAEIMSAYNMHLSANPNAIELLESLQFILKVAMGNHRAALRLKGIPAIEAAKIISTPSFPKITASRTVFQGFMPG